MNYVDNNYTLQKIFYVRISYENAPAMLALQSCFASFRWSTCPLVSLQLVARSRDLSQAEIEITLCKAEKKHKIKIIFTQSLPRTILSCHFVNLLSFEKSVFFSA